MKTRILGYDLINSNLNNTTFDAIKDEKVPDVVLIRKAFDRELRARKRQWKLKRLVDQVETASTEQEFMVFICVPLVRHLFYFRALWKISKKTR